jgi:hypothetical protein
MYEQPASADLDRILSTLTQEVQDQARAAKARVAGASESQGWALSSRFIAYVADALDPLHKEAIAEAMHTVRDFADRMRRPASEVAMMARPRLENLAAALLSEIPDATGFTHEQQQIRRECAQRFQARLDDALRDIGIGFIGGRSLTIKDSDRRLLALQTFYDQRHQQDWTPFPADPATSQQERTVALNIGQQLAQGGLIEWKSNPGAGFGMGRITNRGVDVIEGNAPSPIALTVDARQYSVAGSSNVQIGDGGNKMHITTNTVTQGDVAALDKRLEEIGIDRAAIDALHTAISDDRADGHKPSLRGKVGAWVAEQTGRAATGAFQLGMEQLTPALIEAIKSFFPS